VFCGRYAATSSFARSKLAHIAGVDRTYVGSVERGERNLSVLNILTFATALGIDPGELVSGMSRGPADEARGTV
jgi:transcriptional regulator with XRE-family HTH domain